MRTREEQISHLSCAIFNQHDNIDECIALAQKYILEAERRTEQRIRAEIGRDSERLDWLGVQDIIVGEYDGEKWKEVCLARYQRTLPADLADIRQSMDRWLKVG